MTVRILKGDCREMLRTLPDESVHCCVTSPPYFGLRDYGVEGQPGCPHCSQPILPEDFAGGVRTGSSVELERRRRAAVTANMRG